MIALASQPEAAVIPVAPVETKPASRTAPRTIDALLATVSSSRLTTWLQCRLKFWFRYLSGITKPKPPALHLGGAVHETLKSWNRARWRGDNPSLKTLHDTYMGSWERLKREEPVEFGGEEPEDRETGWKLLETYFRESPIPATEKPEAVEVQVEADMGAGLPRLIGVLDLVRPGGLIVDFKTSGKSPEPAMTAHTTDIQMTGYGLLYREATGHQETGTEIHTLVKTKAPKLVVTPIPAADRTRVDRLKALTQSYVDGLERQDFVPAPGFGCMGCEYFAQCRAWPAKGGAR